MRKTAPTLFRLKPLLGLSILMALTACGANRFELRSNPVHDACVESLLAVHVETGESSNSSSSTLSLDELKNLTLKDANLQRALGYRKYVVHFYRRLEDRDEEVSPIKFPLIWNIDSTKVQTEGTYLVEFLQGNKLKIDFRCEECLQINPQGRNLPGKRSGFETSINTDVTSTLSTEDWHFSFRPRSLKLAEEIGKTWIVRLESQESYLAAAKSRIQVSSANQQNFSLRFSDPLAYRASSFVKELGIAVAMDDKANREKQIDPRLKVLDDEIGILRHRIDSLAASSKPLSGMENGQEQSNSKEMTELQAQQASLTTKEREKSALMAEKFSLVPRLLVVSPGVPCSK